MNNQFLISSLTYHLFTPLFFIFLAQRRQSSLYSKIAFLFSLCSIGSICLVWPVKQEIGIPVIIITACCLILVYRFRNYIAPLSQELLLRKIREGLLTEVFSCLKQSFKQESTQYQEVSSIEEKFIELKRAKYSHHSAIWDHENSIIRHSLQKIVEQHFKKELD